MQARLILEDGTVFTGQSFGSDADVCGEVVFNTAVTGYQNMLANPANYGQIVVMTQPIIGTTGISRDHVEAIKPYVRGLVVREYEPTPSNWRGDYTVADILKEQGIAGISGIDTRMLTRHIRDNGTMKGWMTTTAEPVDKIMSELLQKELPKDSVARVSTSHIYTIPGQKEKIVVIDYGISHGLLQELIARNCHIVVVPYDTSAAQIMAMKPDGIVLSNGPGDPQQVGAAQIETIQQLLPQLPLLAIGLGHQLFALACGATTEELKHGHRGNNHPVSILAANKCIITAQNHGYVVSASSLQNTRLDVTHVHNNDGTIEGLKHLDYAAFSVQFEPEAAPGVHDSRYLFTDFIAMIREKGVPTHA